VLLAGLGFDRLTERQVINHVLGALSRGRGGWIATPNIDICQAAQRDPSLAELVGTASLVVPDGMPLLWAARLRGDRLPERVTGSSLIFTLSAAAARAGRSVYLLGGPPGVPELAAVRLRQRYPDLIVAGCYAPPRGFEGSREGVLAVRRRLAAAGPDIVFVGLGCPKQERLIAAVGPYLPTA
jgi:N-acetylglucosaminyldiphosphoundecaprenol N-acetyl-beta-D-mannosaminyltransferase